MDSMVENHQKYLKNHQKKEVDFRLIKLMVPPLKKLKKLEFPLEGKNRFCPFDPSLTSTRSDVIILVLQTRTNRPKRLPHQIKMDP